MYYWPKYYKFSIPWNLDIQRFFQRILNTAKMLLAATYYCQEKKEYVLAVKNLYRHLDYNYNLFIMYDKFINF